MILVTERQLRLFKQIRVESHRHPENHIIPNNEERKRMESIAERMSATAYFELSENERKKWYVNWNPSIRTEFIEFDEEIGEKLYSTGLYFEPWHPSILDRLY